MADTKFTMRSAFSQAILPRVLFDQSDDQSSMLLARRYACPLLHHLWRQAAESLGASDVAGADAIDTSAVWLGGSLASLMVTFPEPHLPAEPYRALFIIPAQPSDGPRRYFLLERPGAAPQQGSATLSELIDDAAADTGFRRVEHRTGVDATVEAFVAAVEQIIAAVPGSKVDAVENGPGSVPSIAAPPAAGKRPWWQFWG